MAKAIQSEFLPVGTEIAQLAAKLGQIGAFQAMREVQKAAEVFHEDVERIILWRNQSLKLKVFGGCFDGQNRLVVAAKSKAAAGRAFGYKGAALYDFCSETGNKEEVMAAMSEPGTVFVKNHRMNDYFRKVIKKNGP